MLQEDLNYKTISITFKAGRFTRDILQKALIAYLHYHKEHRKIRHGRISVRKLMQQDQGAATIEIDGKGFHDFNRIARKYNVDYAAMRSRDGPAKYTVFFKARDTDVITKAFRDFVRFSEKRKERPSIREKLKTFREKARAVNEKTKELIRQKTAQTERGQSL